MFSPINTSVYLKAAAGFMAGITAPSTDTDAGDYTSYAQMADAFAQEFDTLWGAAPVTAFDLDEILAGTQSYWTGRSPLALPDAVDPASYAQSVGAVIARVVQAGAQIASEGIDADAEGGADWVTSFMVDFRTLPAQTITDGIIMIGGKPFTVFGTDNDISVAIEPGVGLVIEPKATPTSSGPLLSTPLMPLLPSFARYWSTGIRAEFLISEITGGDGFMETFTFISDCNASATTPNPQGYFFLLEADEDLSANYISVVESAPSSLFANAGEGAFPLPLPPSGLVTVTQVLGVSSGQVDIFFGNGPFRSDDTKINPFSSASLLSLGETAVSAKGMWGQPFSPDAFKLSDVTLSFGVFDADWTTIPAKLVIAAMRVRYKP